jgi:ATP-dependent Lon protease
MVSSVKGYGHEYYPAIAKYPSEAGIAIRNIESTSFLINFISSNMNADMTAKQKMLETASLRERPNMVLEHLRLICRCWS